MSEIDLTAENALAVETETPGKIPNKIKNKVLWRFAMESGCGSLNYEKMQALSYSYAMYPALEYLYKDNPAAMKQAMKVESQFFNTNPFTCPFILGVDLAIQEEQRENSFEALPAIKTGLMGPLTGLGDTLLISTPAAIFGGIAASMAVKGNALGALLWIAVMIAIKFSAIPLFKLGYDSGVKLVQSIDKQIKLLTGSISIIGLMVVGALIPTVVKANVTWQYKQGELVVKGQEILDSIMPNIIPALLVFLIWYLLGKKKLTPVKSILLLIVLAIGLSAAGFLG